MRFPVVEAAVRQGPRVLKDRKARPGSMVKMAQMAHLGPPVLKELLELPVRKAFKASKGLPAPMVKMAIPASKVRPVQMVQQDHREFKASRVSRAPQDHKEMMESLGPWVRREQQGRRDLLVAVEVLGLQ